MPGTAMTAAEKDSLGLLDFPIPVYGPGNGGSRNSQPFTTGKRIDKYRRDDLGKEETDSGRTDWFRKTVYLIWRHTGCDVPYAFKTADGSIRSLDAGCIAHLSEGSSPWIDVVPDNDGFIIAVRPLSRLVRYCEDIGEAKLRINLGLDFPVLSSPDSTQVTGAEADQTQAPVCVEEFVLAFDPSDPVDERRKEESKRSIREGAKEFREGLLRLWHGRCAMSGSSVAEALEGAHIYRYLGRQTNHPANGLPLRADVHRLFDRHLIGIRYDGDALAVVCSASLANTEYALFREIALPENPAAHPDRRLVEHRYLLFSANEHQRTAAIIAATPSARS